MLKSLSSLLVVFALAATPVFAQISDEDPLGNTACANLTTSLRYGMRDTDSNNDVAILQDFLASNNYLSSQPTGFFGRMTLNAVKAFQSANGISPTGFVGPATRAKIKDIDCNGVTTPTQPANPGSPVATTFSYASENLFAKFNITDGTDTCPNSYTIAFGDGQEGSVSPNRPAYPTSYTGGSAGGNMYCSGYIANHTYAQAGTYTAKLFKQIPWSCNTTSGTVCPEVMPAPVQVGTLTVTVGGTSMCTLEAKICPDGSSVQRTGPNCEFSSCPVTTSGVPNISSLYPASGKVGTSVTIVGRGFTSNSVVLFDGYSISTDYNASIYGSADRFTFKVPSFYLTGGCGTNTTSGTQPSFCSDFAPVQPGVHTVAIKNANGTSNSVNFTVTTDTVSSAPTISSLSPTSGKVGSQVIINGTGFTTDSSILFDGVVVKWDAVSADIRFTVPAFYPSPCSTATGVYCTSMVRTVIPGTYTVAVKNANGISNSAKFTVTTDTSSGTICTRDMNLCPDGSYVGRTGPNCEFVCPTPTYTNPTAPTCVSGMIWNGSSCILYTSATGVLGVNAVCVDLPYNLHRGYESYAVTKLQEFLKSRNFLGEVTGFYGDKTVAAVNEYQTTKNLPVTGMVYDFTRAAIKGETCQ